MRADKFGEDLFKDKHPNQTQEEYDIISASYDKATASLKATNEVLDRKMHGSLMKKYWGELTKLKNELPTNKEH